MSHYLYYYILTFIDIIVIKIRDKKILLMIFICFRSLSVYFVMFGISAAPFFDISTTFSCGKEERKTKYLLGKYHT